MIAIGGQGSIIDGNGKQIGALARPVGQRRVSANCFFVNPVAHPAVTMKTYTHHFWSLYGGDITLMDPACAVEDATSRYVAWTANCQEPTLPLELAVFDAEVGALVYASTVIGPHNAFIAGDHLMLLTALAPCDGDAGGRLALRAVVDVLAEHSGQTRAAKLSDGQVRQLLADLDDVGERHPGEARFFARLSWEELDNRFRRRG